MSKLPEFATSLPAGHPSRDGICPESTSSSSEQSRTGNTDQQEFDLLGWHSAYQSCQDYFLNHAQHDNVVQAVASLANICLPFQWTTPIVNSAGRMQNASGPSAYNHPWPREGPVSNARGQPVPTWVSLVPYIRRLVVTGMDKDGIMHSFFGEDWRKGVGSVHECERRNYLFTAKSTEWSEVKHHYDMSPHESVPFLKPLQDAHIVEIEDAEQTWSQWLAMQDWMVGPRAPNLDGGQNY
ncbi:hypothetical protein DPSP01_014545 [Paraphaeosphaeria sporulosa]